MGLFEKILKPIKTDAAIKGYFQTFDAYNPTFYSRQGGLYEMDATRAAVHCFATQCGKLKANVKGSAIKSLERNLQHSPNPWQTAYQFQYRLATILMCENTAFLLPVLNKGEETVGVFPVRPQQCSLMEGTNGVLYLRYQFNSGKTAAVEFSKCGVMTQMQYKNDFFGESNAAIAPTLDLLATQNQGIQEGIKSSAALRFMAKLGTAIRPEDLEAEQTRFKNLNLAASNNGGVLIYDTKYSEVKQIDSKPYVVDAEQMKIINDNVYNYFGVSEKMLRNEWDETEGNAFYEGRVEPFALQLSQVLEKMLFTDKQISFGNEITYSADRLQFAPTDKKVSMVTQLFDRGMMSVNEGREVLQLSPVEDGDRRFIRGEYVDSATKTEEQEESDGTEGNKSV